MKNNSAFNFYLKLSLWIFFCLGLAGIICAVRNIAKSGDQSNASSKVAIIHRLQNRYAAKHRGRFAPNFDELIKTENLDERFRGRNPAVRGYVFDMKVSEPTDHKPAFYSITADPLDSHENLRHFYIDSTLGTIRGTDENRPANAADPAI